MKTYKKYIIITFLAFVILLVYFNKHESSISYKKNGTLIIAEEQAEFIDFDKAIAESYLIAEASLNDIERKNNEMVYKFKINNIIKGNECDKDITVIDNISNVLVNAPNEQITYRSGAYDYKIGNDYILVLEKHISVYYDNDIYIVVSDIFMPVEDDTIKPQMYYREYKINEQDTINKKDFLLYVDNLKLRKNDYDFDSMIYGTEYVKSSDIKDIVKNSQHIVKIKVNDMYVEGNTNRDTYYCEIIEEYKGEIKAFEQNENISDKKIIRIPFFKGTVSTGKEYIVMLNEINETSLIYVLSSKNSLYEPTDKTINLVYN